MNARDVQTFFEKVAGDWDSMRLAYYDERVIERMAAVAGPNDTMTVADVGTGTGFVAGGIAPRVKGRRSRHFPSHVGCGRQEPRGVGRPQRRAS